MALYIISITGGFIFVHRTVSGPYCDCGLSLTLTVAAMASSGIIVGIILYYYLSGSFQAEKKSIREKALETARFLPENQRKILEFLVENSGEAMQKDAAEETRMDKVKVSRTLKKMEKRGIVSREENGMSKKMVLEDPFKELLSEE